MFDYVRSTENSQRSDSRRGRRPLTSRSPYRDIRVKISWNNKRGENKRSASVTSYVKLTCRDAR